MVVYSSATQYIESCTSLKAKIAAIDAIISALFATALKAAENENITQYSLNDGQTIISTTYKSVKAITDSIQSMRAIRSAYVQQLQGRVVRMVDSKNFHNGCSGFF